MQYVAHILNFCFCYLLTAQLCDVRTVLECNMLPIVSLSAPFITKEHNSVTSERCYSAICGAYWMLLLLVSFIPQVCYVRTVVECNLWRIEENSAPFIT
jgi:hypothetical protein